MVLVVEPDDEPGQRVCLPLPYGDVVVGSIGLGYKTKQLNTVTPGVVRRGILWAIDHGWSPGHRGPELRLDGAGDDLFGDVMS